MVGVLAPTAAGWEGGVVTGPVWSGMGGGVSRGWVCRDVLDRGLFILVEESWGVTN